jgi:hypothetical protein
MQRKIEGGPARMPIRRELPGKVVALGSLSTRLYGAVTL